VTKQLHLKLDRQFIASMQNQLRELRKKHGRQRADHSDIMRLARRERDPLKALMLLSEKVCARNEAGKTAAEKEKRKQERDYLRRLSAGEFFRSWDGSFERMIADLKARRKPSD
jgi:hypothetical protein